MKGVLILLVLLLGFGEVDAHVTLDSPLGGESYDPGEIVTIKWHETVGHLQDNWDLYYSVDGGLTWIELGIDLPVEQKTFYWTAPEISSSTSRIRIIMDNEGRDYEDESGDFSVGVFSPVNLKYPMGDENLLGGANIFIKWAVNGFVSFDFWNLLFSDDGGNTWKIIEENLAMGKLSQEWVLPQIITNMARIKLEMNISGVIYEDISGVFTISEELITSLPSIDQGTRSTQAYPNPFNEKIIFKIDNKNASRTTLKIFDQLGRSVFETENINLTGSNFTMEWQPINKPAGIYFYKLHSIEGIESGKIFYQQ